MKREPPLTAEFEKTQDFPKVILLPGEKTEYELTDFFRGQLIHYEISDIIPYDSLKFNKIVEEDVNTDFGNFVGSELIEIGEGGHEVSSFCTSEGLQEPFYEEYLLKVKPEDICQKNQNYLEATNFSKIPSITATGNQMIPGTALTPEISVMPPLREHFEMKTFNKGKKFRELNFPNSSLLMTLLDVNVLRKYFVTIDRSLELLVYQLNEDGGVSINHPLTYPLNRRILNTETPLCANLQLLSQRQLFFYCLGKEENETIAVQVQISDSWNLSFDYMKKELPFDEFFQGQIVVRYIETENGVPPENGDYVAVFKSGASSQEIQVEFWNSISEKKTTYPIDKIHIPEYHTSVEPQFKHVSPFFGPNNLFFVVSDFVHGLLLYKLDLDNKKADFINWQPLSDLTSTFVVPNEEASSDIAYTVFGVTSKPPNVIEATFLENNFENPFVSRIYRVNEDEDKFIALPAISANHNYILVQLLDYETFSPVLRIYRRGRDNLSFAHTQIRFDSAMVYQPYFTSFFTSFDNSFLIENEQSLKIYYINQQTIKFDGSMLDSKQIQSNFEQGKVEQFYLNITARSLSNESQKVINSTIQVLVLSQEVQGTVSRIPNTLGSPTWIIYYVCGVKNFKQSLIKYYSGSYKDIKVKFNQTADYFTVVFPGSKKIFQQEKIKRNRNKCELASLGSFQINSKNQHNLVCFSKDKGNAYMVNLFKVQTHESSNNQLLSFPGLKFQYYFWINSKHTLIALSSTTIDGIEKSSFQVFKMNNILAWTDSFGIEEIFSWRSDVSDNFIKLGTNKNVPLVFNSLPMVGGLISQRSYNTMWYVLFNVDLERKPQIKVTSYQQIHFNRFSGEFVNSYVCNKGMLWVQYNNNTIITYNEEMGAMTEFGFLRPIYETHYPESMWGQNAIRSINLSSFRPVIFLQKNKILVHQIHFAPFRMKFISELPMNQEENKDLEFVINSFLKTVVEKTYKNYLFVLFKDTNREGSNIKLLVWDLFVSAHNSYIMQIPFDYQVHSDKTNNIEIFINESEDEENYDVEIILIDGNEVVIKYEVSLGTNLEVNHAFRDDLYQDCANQNVTLDLEIGSTLINETDKLFIQSIDQGLVIKTSKSDNDSQINTVKETKEELEKLAHYEFSFSSLETSSFFLQPTFRGQFMDYKYKCLNYLTYAEEPCFITKYPEGQNLDWMKQVKTYSSVLPFLSSERKIVNSYSLEFNQDLYFDTFGYIIQLQQKPNRIYEHLAAPQYLPFKVIKSQLFHKIYENPIGMQGQVSEKVNFFYLLTFHLNQGFEVNKTAWSYIFKMTLCMTQRELVPAFMTKSNGIGALEVQQYDQSLNENKNVVDGSMFFTLKNFKTADYRPNQNNHREGILVIVYELQKDLFSGVQVYNLTLSFDGSVSYNLMEHCQLNAFNQGFNSFSIDSLQFFQPPSERLPFLALGVANYGIAAVDLNTCQNWANMPIYGLGEREFKVLEISSSDQSTIYVSTDVLGMREYNFKYNGFGMEAQIEFEELKGRSLVNLQNEVITQVAALQDGFAVTSQTLDSDGNPVERLVFFDFMNNIDSSALSMVQLKDFGNCVHLDQARMSVAQVEATKHRFFNVSMICGFSHMTWSVDLSPRIELGYQKEKNKKENKEVHLQEHSSLQLLHITAYNGITEAQIIVKTAVIQETEPFKLGYLPLIAIMVGATVVVWSAFKGVERKFKKQNKKKKNQ